MPVIVPHSDVQSDMARNDEEGSGSYRDENDDEEYGGSGDGSGEGNFQIICNKYFECLIQSFILSF